MDIEEHVGHLEFGVDQSFREVKASIANLEEKVERKLNQMSSVFQGLIATGLDEMWAKRDAELKGLEERLNVASTSLSQSAILKTQHITSLEDTLERRLAGVEKRLATQISTWVQTRNRYDSELDKIKASITQHFDILNSEIQRVDDKLPKLADDLRRDHKVVRDAAVGLYSGLLERVAMLESSWSPPPSAEQEEREVLGVDLRSKQFETLCRILDLFGLWGRGLTLDKTCRDTTEVFWIRHDFSASLGFVSHDDVSRLTLKRRSANGVVWSVSFDYCLDGDNSDHDVDIKTFVDFIHTNFPKVDKVKGST